MVARTPGNNSPFQIPFSTPILLVLLVVGFFFSRWRLLTSGASPLDIALQFFYLIVALIVGITIHEFSHAFVARLQGDTTAERAGRVSLNPIRHLDPFGSLMIVFAGFGWGKPTPYNPMALSLGPHIGSALVAAAGPISNIVTATAFALPFYAGLVPAVSGWGLAGQIIIFSLYSIVAINIALAVFNLLPVPPLDGFGFLVGVLPPSAGNAVERLGQYGPIVLLILIGIPFFIPGFNPLAAVMTPIIDGLQNLILPIDVVRGSSRFVVG